MPRFMTIAVALATVGFVSTTTLAADLTSGLAGKWHILNIEGVADLKPANTEVTIADDGAMTLTVGCNRMRANPKIAGAKFAIGPITSTRMACEPPLALQERALQQALEAARSVKLEDAGARATLLDISDTLLVTLKRKS
jgi:heat shock protein HslJ